MNWKKKIYQSGAEFRVAGIYVLVGVLWIIFSDKVLLSLVDEMEWLTWIQTIKGWFFVVATGFLIFFLVYYESMKKHRILRDLQNAQVKAQEAERLKSAFLTNMSHEIRTPLNGIMGFAELLKINHESQEEREEYLSIIQQSGTHLLSILNDLIDISKLEAQQLVVEKKLFSLACLIDDIFAYAEFNLKSQGKNLIQFSKNIPEEGGGEIYSDPVRLKQILSHLMSNATKFTERGTITLGYQWAGKGLVKIYVEDTGRGIAQGKLKNIFDPFTQEDQTLSRDQGGTGIGLSLCKELVQLLGGTIEVYSKKGKGSCFTVFLPGNSEDGTVL